MTSRAGAVELEKWLRDWDYKPIGKYSRVGILTEHDLNTLNRGNLQDIWLWISQQIRPEVEIQEIRCNRQKKKRGDEKHAILEYEKKKDRKQQLIADIISLQEENHTFRMELQEKEERERHAREGVQKHNIRQYGLNLFTEELNTLSFPEKITKPEPSVFDDIQLNISDCPSTIIVPTSTTNLNTTNTIEDQLYDKQIQHISSFITKEIATVDEITTEIEEMKIQQEKMKTQKQLLQEKKTLNEELENRIIKCQQKYFKDLKSMKQEQEKIHECLYHESTGASIRTLVDELEQKIQEKSQLIDPIEFQQLTYHDTKSTQDWQIALDQSITALQRYQDSYQKLNEVLYEKTDQTEYYQQKVAQIMKEIRTLHSKDLPELELNFQDWQAPAL